MKYSPAICTTVGVLLSFSKSQFPHVQNESDKHSQSWCENLKTNTHEYDEAGVRPDTSVSYQSTNYPDSFSELTKSLSSSDWTNDKIPTLM